MIEQASFDFTARPILPEVGEVERLLAWLAARPGFHTAKQLSAALNLTDRQIRQLAEAADGLIVSGPGSQATATSIIATTKPSATSPRNKSPRARP